MPADTPPTVLHLSFLRAARALLLGLLPGLRVWSEPAAAELARRVVAVAVTAADSCSLPPRAVERKLVITGAQALRALARAPPIAAQELATALEKALARTLDLERAAPADAVAALVQGLVGLAAWVEGHPSPDSPASLAAYVTRRLVDLCLPPCDPGQPPDGSILSRASALFAALDLHAHDLASPALQFLAAESTRRFLAFWQAAGPRALASHPLPGDWVADACACLRICVDLCPEQALSQAPALLRWAALCLATPGGAAAGPLLADVVARQAITVPQLVLAEIGPSGPLAPLYRSFTAQAAPMEPDAYTSLSRVLQAALSGVRPTPPDLARLAASMGARGALDSSPDIVRSALGLLGALLAPLGVEDERRAVLESVAPCAPLVIRGFLAALATRLPGGRLPLLADLASNVALLALLCALQEGRAADAAARQAELLSAWTRQATELEGLPPAVNLAQGWDWGPPAELAQHRAARLLGLDSDPAAEAVARRGTQRAVRAAVDALRQ